MKDNNYYKRYIIKRDSLWSTISNYPLKVYHGLTQEMSDRVNFGEPLLLHIMQRYWF